MPLDPVDAFARIQRILVCPECRQDLSFPSTSKLDAQCPHCSFTSQGGDFLPRRPLTRALHVPTLFDPVVALAAAAIGPPQLTYSGPPPHRNAVDVFSLLPRSTQGEPALALDLGCGHGEYQPVFEALGYQYVGVDVSGPGPTMLADAHALPFQDASMDVVFSMAVLEHVHNPFLALSEIYRVLKPGGLFLGAASFGEPFHGSYFHSSPWGVVSLMQANGFVVYRLWSCRDTLDALAEMSGYPRIVRGFLRGTALIAHIPWLSPRRWRS